MIMKPPSQFNMTMSPCSASSERSTTRVSPGKMPKSTIDVPVFASTKKVATGLLTPRWLMSRTSAIWSSAGLGKAA
ncbi:hypothetical protein SN15_05785 [Stenotrophomonas maltophilia]|nr:hypothetical protein SN15_05785 [Stenotrophomonas maltophilia]